MAGGIGSLAFRGRSRSSRQAAELEKGGDDGPVAVVSDWLAAVCGLGTQNSRLKPTPDPTTYSFGIKFESLPRPNISAAAPGQAHPSPLSAREWVSGHLQRKTSKQPAVMSSQQQQDLNDEDWVVQPEDSQVPDHILHPPHPSHSAHERRPGHGHERRRPASPWGQHSEVEEEDAEDGDRRHPFGFRLDLPLPPFLLPKPPSSAAADHQDGPLLRNPVWQKRVFAEMYQELESAARESIRKAHLQRQAEGAEGERPFRFRVRVRSGSSKGLLFHQDADCGYVQFRASMNDASLARKYRQCTDLPVQRLYGEEWRDEPEQPEDQDHGEQPPWWRR